MPIFTIADYKTGAVLPQRSLPLFGDVVRYVQLVKEQNPSFPHAQLVNKVVGAVCLSYSSLDYRLKGSRLRTKDYLYTKISRLVVKARPILNGKGNREETRRFLVQCQELFDVFKCR